MSFTGKATYTAGTTLPEIAEDVSDLVALNSPFETPLLDALGDATHPARSTVHEWLEDELIATSDVITDVVDATHVEVGNVSRFRAGDQLRLQDSSEMLLITEVDSGTGVLTLTRGYGGTASGTLDEDMVLHNLGNAALKAAMPAMPA